MRTLALRTTVLLLSTALALGLAEVAYRALGPVPGPSTGQLRRIESLQRSLGALRDDLRAAAVSTADDRDPLAIVRGARDALRAQRDRWQREVDGLEGEVGIPERLVAELRGVGRHVADAYVAAEAGVGVLQRWDRRAAPDTSWAAPMFAALDSAHSRSTAIVRRLDRERRENVRYTQFFEALDGAPLDLAELAESEFVRPVESSPRPRYVFEKGFGFRLCYRPRTQDYLDERGCVELRFNSRGCREREELCRPKADDEFRIVCLGDSFTIGWGVREEASWPRRLETSLDGAVPGETLRTVNCGFAGTLYVDEYAAGLEHRFADYEPDVVLVALFGNDLVYTNSGLCHFNREPAAAVTDTGSGLLSSSRLLRAVAGTFERASDAYPMQSQLTFEPGADVGARLLAMPPGDPAYTLGGVDPGLFWPSGGPQRALSRMQVWCAERGIRFGVLLWPFLQGLGPGEQYPFTAVHAAVAFFCDEQRIPFLDLLPVLHGRRPTPELWVSPGDMHPDEETYALTAPAIEGFVRPLLQDG